MRTPYGYVLVSDVFDLSSLGDKKDRTLVLMLLLISLPVIVISDWDTEVSCS